MMELLLTPIDVATPDALTIPGNLLELLLNSSLEKIVSEIT